MIITIEEAITIIDNLHLIGCGHHQHENDLKINVALDMAIEALQADRSTGEWIHEKMPVPPYYLTPSCHCNQCGVFVVQESNYCPNCGAQMKGADDE